MPKRVASVSDDTGHVSLSQPPGEFVQDLLERAAVLLETLANDVAGLREDQEEEKLRIEQERSRLLARAESARDQLASLLNVARQIAQNKGKQHLLSQGLESPVGIDTSYTVEDAFAALDQELKAARGITGAMRLPQLGELFQQAEAAIDRMVEEADRLEQRLLHQAEEDLNAESKEARASFEIGLMILNRDLEILDRALPLEARPWSNDAWRDWSPGASPVDSEVDTRGLIRLGCYENAELETQIPLLVKFPGEKALQFEVGGRRNEAVQGVQSLILRVLAGTPPGGMRLAIIDPKGLGDSAAPFLPLGEVHPDLLSGGVATTPEDIESLLAHVTRHIERVIQQYLRGRYASLRECNEAAGDILEPYLLLVVFDHPTGLSESANRLLDAIIENGPRCGVHTITTKDSQPAVGFASPWNNTWGAAKPAASVEVFKADADSFWIEVPRAGRWNVRLDRPPAPSVVERIIAVWGRQARERHEAAISLKKLYQLLEAGPAGTAVEGVPELSAQVDPEDPSTWWSGSARSGVGVPIGRTGATDLASIWLSGGSRAHLFVAGKRGSGLSTLLQTSVLGWTMLYPPEELRLYLLSLRGRSFAPYMEVSVPHAAVIAADAGREFAVAVLDTLSAEADRRIELLRSTVGERVGYLGYRNSGKQLPRIVAVVEGFGELFASRDKLAEQAAATLDRVARLGGIVGIHLVLATESADERAVRAKIVGSLRSRLLLPMSENDAKLVAGEGAAEVASLQSPGDVFLASSIVDPLTYRRFRSVYVDRTELDLCLRDLERLSQERGAAAATRVFDGEAVARLETREVASLIGDPNMQHTRQMPRLWLGDPMTLGDPVEALLRRQDGANLIIVAENPDIGQGILIAAMTTAVLVHGGNIAVIAVDFMPMEAGFSEAARILGNGEWTVQLARRRSLPKVLDVIHRIVQDRLTAGDYRSKPVLFVLNGLSRARDIDANAGTDQPDELDLSKLLETIVHDGPEVGVHTLAWCETLPSLNRRLTKAASREFALRVAGPMNAEDSSAFIESEAAANLRQNQAVLYDEDWGRLVTFRPFAIPSPEWLANLTKPSS
ncbi:MAG: FtsK/SpoIIIE domain-containing protein [Acidimicrobiales bacterium]|nr:FtsK/SpoIIIE domain-containing protein [Acidimicrobiales bacterium]